MNAKTGLTKGEIWAFVLLVMISFFIFSDQNLMAPNLTQIANSFGFNAVQKDVMLGGDISLAFWVLGGLVTLGVGYLTDLISRKKLFVIVIILGATASVLTGLVQNYEQFFWCRVFTGISIGGALPLTYSLIGDYFSNKNRGFSVSFIVFAQGLGIAVGQLVAGFWGPTAGWRLPFIIFGIPNFVLALLFWLTIKEPRRGRSEVALKTLIESGHAYAARINWTEYKDIFQNKTNILMFIHAIPGSVPWGVFFIYLNDFLSQQKGFTVETATVIVMIIGIGTLIGGLLGGIIGDKLHNYKSWLQPIFCGTAVILAVVPTLIMLNYPPQFGITNPEYLGLAIMSLVTGIIVNLTAPNAIAILLNVNAPEARGSVLSLFNLVNDLGKGLGPWVVAMLIVSFQRQQAFELATLFWVLCGLILLSVALTYARDETRLSQLLKQKVLQLESAANPAGK